MWYKKRKFEKFTLLPRPSVKILNLNNIIKIHNVSVLHVIGGRNLGAIKCVLGEHRSGLRCAHKEGAAHRAIHRVQSQAEVDSAIQGEDGGI